MVWIGLKKICHKYRYFYLAIILKISNSKEIFKAFDKNHSAINTVCFYQLFCDGQVISTKKMLL